MIGRGGEVEFNCDKLKDLLLCRQQFPILPFQCQFVIDIVISLFGSGRNPIISQRMLMLHRG